MFDQYAFIMNGRFGASIFSVNRLINRNDGVFNDGVDLPSFPPFLIRDHANKNCIMDDCHHL